MRFVRMKPGHGDVLLAEGDVEVAEDEERLVEEFRRQLDEGMWAAVPSGEDSGRHEATMVRDFSEVPREADRVIFFPKAAGGR
jgi:molybdopterin converting factor small subunit